MVSRLTQSWWLSPPGCVRHYGVFWEPLHPLVRQRRWKQTFCESSDHTPPHECSLVLGSTAYHLHQQPHQRHCTKVSAGKHRFMPSLLRGTGLSGDFGTYDYDTTSFQVYSNKHMLLFFRHLAKLPRLLENDDVNMRIAAGETIALLFELIRDVDPVSCNYLNK